MNERAAAIGCEDTHFVNTNGLPDENHYTTAWDLYLITKLWVRSVPSSRVIRSAPRTTLSRLRLLRGAEAARQG